MAETPTPQTLDAEDSDVHVTGATESSRRRSVSAFAPASGSRPPMALMSDAQRNFVSALRQCDVGSELRGDELGRVAGFVEDGTPEAQHIDILASYYGADGRPLAAERRRATDRWFLFDSGAGCDAAQVVKQISAVAPELGDAQLVRLGSEHGALVLRSGEDVCALEDEPGLGGGPTTVSVRHIVRAFNVLLDRKHVRVRLVGLAGDGRREAYLGQSSMSGALALLQKGYLCCTAAEELMDLCAW